MAEGEGMNSEDNEKFDGYDDFDENDENNENDVYEGAPPPVNVDLLAETDYSDDNYVYESVPPPENVELLAAGLRAAADAIQAEVGNLSNRENKGSLRSVAHHAGRAAEIAGRIARFATDPDVGWQDLWMEGKYDPEWETEIYAPPGPTPPDEEGE